MERILRLTLFVGLLLLAPSFAQPTETRFRDLPAGTEVKKLRVSDLQGMNALDESMPGAVIIQVKNQPINLQLNEGETVRFWHPHVLIEPNPYVVRPLLRPTGPAEVPTQKESFGLSPRLNPHSLVLYAFVYQKAIGIGLVLALSLAGWLLYLNRKKRHIESAAQVREKKLSAFLGGVSDSSHPLVGETLDGKYLVGEVLGQGGMATVYRAIPADTLDQTKAVALKVIQKQFAQDEEFRARFEREAVVSTSLTHPNIVRVEAWGAQEEVLYLALEYVKGESLERAIPRRGWALEKAFPILNPILDGLIYAHENGVVHRDLKPENIMLTESGVPKIMDFGLARSQNVGRVTKTGSALGTPAYMPPEQITGAAPTPAADQYALGVMMFEMFTGRRPFEGDDLMTVIFAQMSETPPSPLEFQPKLNPILGDLILRMLEKNPNSRFESLEVVRQGLEALVATGTWELPPPPGGTAPDDRPPAVQERTVGFAAQSATQDPESTVGFEAQSPAQDPESTIGFQAQSPDPESTVGFQAQSPDPESTVGFQAQSPDPESTIGFQAHSPRGDSEES